MLHQEQQVRVRDRLAVQCRELYGTRHAYHREQIDQSYDNE